MSLRYRRRLPPDQFQRAPLPKHWCQECSPSWRYPEPAWLLATHSTDQLITFDFFWRYLIGTLKVKKDGKILMEIDNEDMDIKEVYFSTGFGSWGLWVVTSPGLTNMLCCTFKFSAP